MNPEVLICSGLYDFSTDLVCVELEKMGVSYVRLNREHFQDYGITLDPVTPRIPLQMEGTDYDIGSRLISVWFRQPVFLRNTPANPLSPSQQLERSQWSAFLRALSVFDQVAWMNFPARTYLAESKPYQLYIASKCGFNVPETYISNDSSEIHRRFPDVAAIKSLDTVLIKENEDSLFAYTNINDTSTLSKETTRHAPLTAQELLSNKRDLRITVIGDSIYAVRILKDGKGIDGDWRLFGGQGLEYESINLSENLRRMCHELANHLGISFAAIDMAETQDHTYFIEVNPTGEWGWLDGASRPISKEIASWLAEPT